LLASVALAQSDLARAREHAEESLALARALGDGVRLAQALNALGEAHAAAGEQGAACAAYEESLDRARESGEQGSVAGTLVNLARVHVQHGDLADAARCLLQAASVIKETGIHHPMYLWLAIAGGFAAAHGQPKRAAMLFGAVDARSKSHGFVLEAVDGAFVAERIAAARDALGEAAFAQARTDGAALPDSHWLEEAPAWLSTTAS
jgi:tetratricopeptide (TPR) repeat protein